MKRPSFQFYPSDWLSDLKLRRCSPAARGVWMDLICCLHDSDDGYGLMRWPLRDIAATAGASMTHVRELVDKGVLRGDDHTLTEPFVYQPRSGRKVGEPVVLVAAQAGPIWYSRRLVKDEYVRTVRGEGTRFGDDRGEGDGDAPKSADKSAPKPPLGDGSSPSTSTPASQKKRSTDGPGDVTADDLVAEGVDPKHAADWLKVRKAKRAPLTASAWTAVKREAERAGMTAAEAVKRAAESSWQGFKAEWVSQGAADGQPAQADVFAGAK